MATKRTYTVDPDRADFIRCAYEQDWTLQQTADALECSREWVRLQALEIGLQFKRSAEKANTQRLKEEAAALLAGGATLVSAARQVSVSVATLSHWGLRSGRKVQEHGLQAYRRGCKCELCREANRKHRRTHFGKEPRQHGTASAYMNYGCRCEDCKRAGSEQNERQAAARKIRMEERG